MVIWCFPWFSCSISLKGNLEFSPFLESKAIKTRFCSPLSICQHEVWCLKIMCILPPLWHPSWWKACWCFWEHKFQLWKFLKCLFMLSISAHIPDLENAMIEVQCVFLLNCHILCSETVGAALPVLGITHSTSRTVIG